MPETLIIVWGLVRGDGCFDLVCLGFPERRLSLSSHVALSCSVQVILSADSCGAGAGAGVDRETNKCVLWGEDTACALERVRPGGRLARQ